ncbi:hypothetical protein QC820_16185 [Halomonas mongoliensis]|uniref:Glycosyltransferase RgtA/B/C/D-like domain-containing protein n=1 Tax=Halomonas mongoliensis TaxID=321265 RepID=A0ABU1GQP5_9GAMM|nr:hypothetical protein [Halomonas mongoliensis]MDR5894330.1 hypothetical protein [Halomonas mongoliensis]
MVYQDIPASLVEILLSAILFISFVLILLGRALSWRTVFLPLFAALVLRTIAALYYRFLGMLPQGGADAVTFERRAWEWAYLGCGNLGEHLNLGSAYVHSWMVGNIYACTDRGPLVFQAINVGFGMATVYLVARVAEELWDREAAVRAAWVAALFPMFIINAAIPLREAWFTALFLLSVLWLVRWVRTWRLLFLLGSAAVMLSAAVLHGSAIFSLGAMGLVVIVWGGREIVRGVVTGHVKAGVFVGAVMLSGAISFGLLALSDVRFSSIGEIGSLIDRADSLDERAATARGGSAYPGYLIPSNDIQMMALTPVRMAYALFGPPPWEVRAAVHIIGMFDGLIYLSLVILIMRYRREWWKRREYRILLAVFLVIALVLAWGVNNFGTATRHRAKFVGILIALAAGLIGRRSWREARLAALHRRRLSKSQA